MINKKADRVKTLDDRIQDIGRTDGYTPNATEIQDMLKAEIKELRHLLHNPISRLSVASDTPFADTLIEEVMAERNHPCNPAAAARAGFEAACRLMNPSASNIFQPAIDLLKEKYQELDREKIPLLNSDPDSWEKMRRLSNVLKSACSFLQVGNPPDYYKAKVVYEYDKPHREEHKNLIMALHCKPDDSMFEAEKVARRFAQFDAKVLSIEITSISNLKFPLDIQEMMK